MGISAKLRHQYSRTNSRVIEGRISSEMRAIEKVAKLTDGNLSQKARKLSVSGPGTAVNTNGSQTK
jgi:hypothetical protein